jgi:O-acetyl-ADP-ribose deacetylase (regulator of RNase III)
MINYIIGDATKPIIETGKRVIAHIVNDQGAWGRGFVTAISARWQDPEDHYRKQAKFSKRFKLGEVQWVFVDIDLAVCNMIAQHGLFSSKNPAPLRYDALERCLIKLIEGARAVAGASDGVYVMKEKFSIHLPRIGCGLARGDWGRVSGLIEDVLWDVDVYVYDLPVD